MKSFITSIAVFGASAAASSLGSAHVINKCSYPVTLCNVPSAGGGYEQQEQTLESGDSWKQQYTELTNGNGWSIKLSKDKTIGTNILQFEYTCHNDGMIWYDLSCVDGNPWDQDWEITATGSECDPKQQAYRYSTDDAYGMQACSDDSSITVTLCTGLSADNGTSVEAPDAPDAPAEPAAPSYESTTAAEAAYTPIVSAWYNWNNKDVANSEAAAAAPTTLSTITTTAAGGAAVTVTEIATAYVTNIVTAYERRHLRHEHGHQHGA